MLPARWRRADLQLGAEESSKALLICCVVSGVKPLWAGPMTTSDQATGDEAPAAWSRQDEILTSGTIRERRSIRRSDDARWRAVWRG